MAASTPSSTSTASPTSTATRPSAHGSATSSRTPSSLHPPSHTHASRSASPSRRYNVSRLIQPSPTSPLRLVITDCPDPSSLADYISGLQLAAPTVAHLVRISDNAVHSYATAPFTAAGIEVHDWIKFDDGTTPTKDQVKLWLEFLGKLIRDAKRAGRAECPAVAIHCVSGIGRAPLLVAVAFVECGMDSLDAVEAIRKVRRGAFNTTQVRWLAEYKAKGTLVKAAAEAPGAAATGSSRAGGAAGDADAGEAGKKKGLFSGLVASLKRKGSKASIVK